MNEDIEAYRKGTKQISEEYIRKTEIQAYNVDSYKVAGYWYFDKRQGELKYRLLGICPMVPDVYEMDNPNPEMIEFLAATGILSHRQWTHQPLGRRTLWSAMPSQSTGKKQIHGPANRVPSGDLA
jgi:hypothetical protein